MIHEGNGRDAAAEAPRRDGDEGSFWELLKYATLALLIVIPIRLFIAQPFIVSGTSMVPTFDDGEYLIVDEISYRFNDPARGDVIIFRFPVDPTKFFIKRIIGLPGETVAIQGSRILVTNDEHPEGIILDEPYISHRSNNSMAVTLGDGEYFVMGDNRSGSSDSRAWGPLDEKYIVGRAFLRLLPIAHAGIFPGHLEKFDIADYEEPITVTE